MPSGLTQMRPEPLLVSGDCAGICAIPETSPRSPNRSFFQETSPLTACTSPLAWAILAMRSAAEIAGSEVEEPAPATATTPATRATAATRPMAT